MYVFVLCYMQMYFAIILIMTHIDVLLCYLLHRREREGGGGGEREREREGERERERERESIQAEFKIRLSYFDNF